LEEDVIVRHALVFSVCLAVLAGMATPSLAAEPQLTVLGPTNQQRVSSSDVQVTFQVSGLTVVPSSVPVAEAGKHPEVNRPGEGHVHLMLDVQPVVVWYTTEPYTFTNVPPGEHRLMVELVNNDHSSLSPPVVQEVQFEVVPAALLPRLSVTAPQSGLTITTSDLQVTFQVSGLTIVPSQIPLAEAGQHPEVNRPGEGHVHFMLDVQPVVVWYTTDPYTLSNVPPGRHRLMVELVNNDHSSLSPPVVQEIAFERLPPALPNTGEPASTDATWLLGLGGLLAVAGAYLRRRTRRAPSR
jgi:LPXTG-motif cell wall-anchored protein